MNLKMSSVSLENVLSVKKPMDYWALNFMFIRIGGDEMTEKQLAEYQKLKAELELETMAQLVDWWKSKKNSKVIEIHPKETESNIYYGTIENVTKVNKKDCRFINVVQDGNGEKHFFTINISQDFKNSDISNLKALRAKGVTDQTTLANLRNMSFESLIGQKVKYSINDKGYICKFYQYPEDNVSQYEW